MFIFKYFFIFYKTLEIIDFANMQKKRKTRNKSL